MKSGNGMAGTGTSPWRCWPTPAWRWSGARRWNQEVRGERGLSQLGRKADTPDGARGPAVALPADMETSTYGRISAAVVPVETAAPGNGPALPLPTPPETPHQHFCNCSTRRGIGSHYPASRHHDDHHARSPHRLSYVQLATDADPHDRTPRSRVFEPRTAARWLPDGSTNAHIVEAANPAARTARPW